LNELVVLIISVLAMPVFSYLPQASVAALLIYASVRMAPIYYTMDLWRNDKGSCALLIVTTLICVFMDPVYGLIVGMILALLRDAAETASADSRLTVLGQVGKVQPMEEDAELNANGDGDFKRGVSHESQRSLRTVDYDVQSGLEGRPSPIALMMMMFHSLRGSSKQAASADANIEGESAGRVILYEPIGPVVYLAADRHCARLKGLSQSRKKPALLVLSLELTSRVDVDGSAALAKGIKQLRDGGVDVAVVVPPQLKHGVLGRAGWLASLDKEGRVFQHRREALRCHQEEVDVEQHPSVQMIPI